MTAKTKGDSRILDAVHKVRLENRGLSPVVLLSFGRREQIVASHDPTLFVRQLGTS